MELCVCLCGEARDHKHVVSQCVFVSVCLCAFAAFRVTQLCVSPIGAFGRLSGRWMTAVISTTALCLAATSSLSPFLVPHASFLLPFTAGPAHPCFLSLFPSILPPSPHLLLPSQLVIFLLPVPVCLARSPFYRIRLCHDERVAFRRRSRRRSHFKAPLLSQSRFFWLILRS